MSFFWSRILSRLLYYIESSCLLGLLLAGAVSPNVLGFDDLDMFLENWAILQDALLLRFICFLIIKTEFMGFGEEDHRGRVSFSTHNINSIFYHHDLWLLMLTLAGRSPGWKVVFIRCLHCTVSPPLSYRPLWKSVTMHSPHLRRKELGYPTKRRVST